MPYFLLRVMSGLTILLLSAAAWGQVCTVTNPKTKAFTPPPTITYAADAPIGSVLMSGAFTGSAGTYTVTCNADVNVTNYVPALTPVSSLAGVYPTTAAGVGIRINNITGVTGPWPVVQPLSFTIAANTSQNITATRDMNFQLVKTGAITSGTILTGDLGFGKYGTNGAIGVTVRFATDLTFLAVAKTCTVPPETQVMNVNLGGWNKNIFTAVGSSSPEVPFNIKVVCSNTVAGTSMAVTFTDALNSTNVTNSLTAEGTASGLALRIKRLGTPISYGAGSASATNANRVVLSGSFPNGTYTFPFTVSMVRTGTVNVGSVSATATFTMSYQ